MYILTAQQIRNWDAYTIEHEPVSSLNLMERAATACVQWLMQQNFSSNNFHIFCGKGNNGGDGLAIARLLVSKNKKVQVHIIEEGRLGTTNFQENLSRLHQHNVPVHYIQQGTTLPALNNEIIVDALLGTGVNKPVQGLYKKVIDYINTSNNTVVSIDVPSGMFADEDEKNTTVLKATHTVSFQCYKPSFLFAANEKLLGHLHVLNIGLHQAYPATIEIKNIFIGNTFIQQHYKSRNKFSHKGNYGHVLIVAGSYGKMGAAVLNASACLHAGIGLLSCYIPACGYNIMQTTVPEAMIFTDHDKHCLSQVVFELDKFNAAGVGPGIGTTSQTAAVIHQLLQTQKKLVLDADALNIIAADEQLKKLLNHYHILTPHPKEFDRLFGSSVTAVERLDKAKKAAAQYGCIIIIKGHRTQVVSPGGDVYFNTTGNAGMATGGTGDVLTGIITSLVAQGYSNLIAACMGVYLHGKAGDIACVQTGQEALTASGIIANIGRAFLSIPHNGE
jgi:ADP-dependent NAD(P)H-hydrate dehydratase / NAD(P)H-hydrate epimerase